MKPYPAKIKEILSEVEEKYKYNEQNDSNEFITIFLNQLLKDLKEIGEYKGGKIPDNELEKKAFLKLENRFFLQNKSFLLNLFYGRLKREYICENGHTCLVKFNNYNTLILPQPEKSNNIIDLLKLYQQNKKIEDKILCNIYKSELNIQLKHLFMIFQNILYYICLDYQKIIDAKDFTDNNTDRERDIILLNVKKDNWYHISDSSSLDEKGEPFWRGSKIMPHPINFNVKDDLSIKFIFYLIKIINRILRINLNIKQDEIINRSYNIYEKIISKEYNLLTEKEQIDTIEKNKLKIKELIKESKLKDMNFNPEKFEKDNDDLFHVDFTFCFSNLRARNYNIEECDKEKVRKIAGNIIPAIVSTTACIAGFVALQIYSVIVSNDINLMRNMGLDLGNSWYSRINNDYNLIDIPFTFSIWDSISIKGNLIAKDFIDIFKKEYNIDIDYINANNECLLDMIENENDEDINKTIEELFL